MSATNRTDVAAILASSGSRKEKRAQMIRYLETEQAREDERDVALTDDQKKALFNAFDSVRTVFSDLDGYTELDATENDEEDEPTPRAQASSTMPETPYRCCEDTLPSEKRHESDAETTSPQPSSHSPPSPTSSATIRVSQLSSMSIPTSHSLPRMKTLPRSTSMPTVRPNSICVKGWSGDTRVDDTNNDDTVPETSPPDEQSRRREMKKEYRTPEVDSSSSDAQIKANLENALLKSRRKGLRSPLRGLFQFASIDSQLEEDDISTHLHRDHGVGVGREDITSGVIGRSSGQASGVEVGLGIGVGSRDMGNIHANSDAGLVTHTVMNGPPITTESFPARPPLRYSRSEKQTVRVRAAILLDGQDSFPPTTFRRLPPASYSAFFPSQARVSAVANDSPMTSRSKTMVFKRPRLSDGDDYRSIMELLDVVEDLRDVTVSSRGPKTTIQAGSLFDVMENSGGQKRKRSI